MTVNICHFGQKQIYYIFRIIDKVNLSTINMSDSWADVIKIPITLYDSNSETIMIF